MTAAVLRSSPNLAVPQTQNTAPVFEFNCLYTHDLRRKQKRWQDGFLRYHTFNKRVMVYDVPRNFLGDLHWTSGDDLQEGDEMTLEKGGIMVEVSERIGTIQTDLSDLLQRKDKTPAKTPAPRTIVRHGTPLSAAQSVTPRTPHGISKTPMKHKSLNALLGRSRRPIGKASLPTESPFEVRNRDLQTTEAQEESIRKRSRLDSDVQARKAKKHRDQTPEGQQQNPIAIPNQVCQVIDLSSDTEDIAAAQAASHAIEAELLATSSPARLHESPAPRQVRPNHFRPIDRRPATIQQAVVESPSVRVPSRKAFADVPAPAAATARPAKETSVSRDTAKTKAIEMPADDSIRKCSFFGPEPESQARGKSLKLVGGVPRKMLLFQSQNSRPASSEKGAECVGRDRAPSTRREASPGQPKVAPRPVQATSEPTADQLPEESVFQRRLQERLAKLSNKNKRTGLQRSSSDVTEQRPANDKAPSTTGLRKTTSVVMSRLDSPEDPTLTDFAFPDMTPMDFDDPIVDESVAQPPTRKSNEPVGKAPRPNGRGTGTISARSFKPLTVKLPAAPSAPTAPADPAASVITSKAAQMIAAEEKKNQDIGPWSKEAFDLMDWRPPNMQAKVSKSV
ncbi:hypothetical protein D6C86_01156 [Aureobasidium pullulans]|uniref:5'-3' DNA helicase ZGRF1-like N-terminal domain-containing protein n=1 Tax=Aureobasidium pullulans TaxID=5580 RepID=A0A4S9VAX3_AURPU|nr:hypothetical protein D6D25_05496 [Aureobasidium pullulans]THY77360.1 hypothetical protein D6C94_02244 [Aureobasidium pullulans]THZ48157.1 hypothetical protein D6C87_00911 [Aureobasidium pullulans]THZ66873.1 hypothetical protein D6C86_01156 [Aureobasidium pullulans]THZ95968.1 hypothetical protein D6C88_01748 [Aureobasidium pullulans]